MGKTNIPGGGGVAVEGVKNNYIIANENFLKKGFLCNLEGNTLYESGVTGKIINTNQIAGEFRYHQVINLSKNKLVLVGEAESTDDHIKAEILEVANGATSENSIYDISNEESYNHYACRIDDNRFAVAYRSGLLTVKVVVCTVSGTAITRGTPYTVSSGDGQEPRITYIGNDKLLIAYDDGSNNDRSTVVAVSISGNTVTGKGNVISLNNSHTYARALGTLETDKAVLVYDSSVDNTVYACVIEATGTTITNGTQITIGTDRGSQLDIAVKNSELFCVLKKSNVDGTPWVYPISVSGNTLTLGTGRQITGSTSEINDAEIMHIYGNYFAYTLSNLTCFKVVETPLKTVSSSPILSQNVGFYGDPSICKTEDGGIVFCGYTGTYTVYAYLIDYFQTGNSIAQKDGIGGETIPVLEIAEPI